ncbi:MAG: sulfotransferase family 2 domain-containing protein [Rhodobacterales bacterium]
MIISHGRKYIFVHIPKTGGTSLSLALESKAMKDDILIGDTPKAKNRRTRIKPLQASGRLWKHARLRDIYGPVTQAQIESYFVFTIVRNPWDRMVSYYHWLKAQSFDHPAVGIAKICDFTDFLHDPSIRLTLQNDGASTYVSDKDGVDRCNLYLRMEHLAEDTNRLGRSLDLKLPDLPHHNPSLRRQDYTPYYDAQSQALIAGVFAKDIQKFSYSF